MRRFILYASTVFIIMLILSMVALLSTTQIAFAEDIDGKMSFKNNYGADIKVVIYHASLDESTVPATINFGKQQKGARIKNGNKNTFIFRAGANCNSKKRGFKIFDYSTESLITEGYFQFKPEEYLSGRSNTCKQRVQTPEYDKNFVSYREIKASKGEFTINPSN